MRPPVKIGLTIDCVPSVEEPGMWRAIVTSWHGIAIYWHDAEDRQTALAGAREAVRAIESGIFKFMARCN